MDKKYNIAVVGASGLVGRTMLQVLNEYDIAIDKLYLFGSARSAGKIVEFRGNQFEIIELTKDVPSGIDFALFSAGGSTSREFAPIFAEKGTVVIDNSSAWRMNENCPLVVPEVNAAHLNNHKNIIANPNCSTIQMVLPLKALSDKYGLKRVVVSTYQSISGAGQKGIDKLNHEIAGIEDNNLSKHPIAYNAFFHSFNDDSGFTEEEVKMINETRKILDLPQLNITATCVRLPIIGGHGESLNVELNSGYELNELKQTIAQFPGIVLMDGEEAVGNYPTIKTCEGRDEVFVGRVRRDLSVENGVHIWLTADNVRKGAASNAVQIMQKLIANEK